MAALQNMFDGQDYGVTSHSVGWSPGYGPTPYTGPAIQPQKIGGGLTTYNGQPTGLASTQTGRTTAPQAEQAREYWSNVNGVNMPNFYRDDYEWKDYNYTPGQWNANAFGATGDSGPIWEDEKVESGGWMLTDAARERLRAGGWDLSNRNNMAFNMNAGRNGLKGTAAPEWVGNDIYDANYTAGGDNGYNGRVFNKEATDAEYAKLKESNPLDFIRDAMYKTGEKEGQAVKYKRDGDRLVAVNAGSGEWDTNISNRARNVALGKAALTVATAGAAAPATMLGQAAQGLGFINTFSGGKVPGLSELGWAAGLANGVGGLVDGVSNGINSVGDAFNLAKAGYGVYNKGSQIMDALNPQQPTDKMGNPRAPSSYMRDPNVMYGQAELPGMGSYAPGGPNYGRPWNGYTDGPESLQGNGVYSNVMPRSWGGGTNWMDLIFGGQGGGQTGIMDIIGGIDGSRQAKDHSQNLKRMYDEAQARRQPVLDRLNESYTNPNSFYDSNQWKGLESVYQNNIDRQASAGGTIANPMDREAKLNNYAMKELENYRTGLRDQMGKLNPDAYINPMTRSAELEARARNPLYAMGGRGSVGGPGTQGGAGGLEGIIRQITNLVGGGGGGQMGNAPNIARSVEQILRGVGGQAPAGQVGGVGMGGWNSGSDVDTPYNPFTGTQEDVYGSDTYGDGAPEWGMPEISFGDWNFGDSMNFDNIFSGGSDYDLGTFDFGSASVDDIGGLLEGFSLEW